MSISPKAPTLGEDALEPLRPDHSGMTLCWCPWLCICSLLQFLATPSWSDPPAPSVVGGQDADGADHKGLSPLLRADGDPVGDGTAQDLGQGPPRFIGCGIGVFGRVERDTGRDPARRSPCPAPVSLVVPGSAPRVC